MKKLICVITAAALVLGSTTINKQQDFLIRIRILLKYHKQFFSQIRTVERV